MRDNENCLGCGEPLPTNARIDRMYCGKQCNHRHWKQRRDGKVAPLPTRDPIALIAQMQPYQLGWVAGIIEGEGSITTSSVMRIGNLYIYPLIIVAMTDEDTIRRLAEWTRVGRVSGPFRPPSRGTNKPHWTWSVNKMADVEALLDAIWPLLGTRRREQATILRKKVSERTLKRAI